MEISTTAPVSYLLITMKAIELEAVCLSDMENLRTADDIYSLLNRDSFNALNLVSII